MYNAVVRWVKDNLIYNTPHYRAESNQEFNNKLHKRIKGYNNKAIVFEKPIAPDESLIEMDLEIGGKRIKAAKVTHREEKVKNGANMILTNETGDVLKHVHITSGSESKTDASKQGQSTSGTKPKVPVAIPKFVDQAPPPRTKSKTELTRKELMSQECTQRQTERIEELNREKEENDDNAEVLGIPLPFRSIGERSSLTDLHNLLEQCPQPQPPLINKQLRTLQLNADQAVIMTEQVKKMKTGMERLQEIIKKFNCTERFKQDIDFIIANVGPALAKSEKQKDSEQALCDMQEKKKKKQEKKLTEQ